MLTADQRFVVNRLEVAAKVIDDEAIIMHLGSGMYYSMDRTGAVIWEWLERGHTMAQIIGGLIERYDVSPGQAGEDVEQLLQRLLDEVLVQPAPADGSSVEPVAPSGGDKLAYTSPELNRYGDMADLLALDPPMPNLASTPWTDPKVDH